MLTLLAGLALLWVSWQIITPILRTLILFALAAILAFTLAPAVTALEQRLGHLLVAIVLLYLLVRVSIIG